MPNWCDNSARISNQDKTKIDDLEKILTDRENQQVFNYLRPRPADQEENWYDWNINNWGTKWECGIIDWERQDDNTIWMSFDSAWSPPTALYEFLVEHDWEVEAFYHEPGMAYAGMFTTDGGDEYYEYDVTSASSIEDLPQDIVEFAGLEDAHEEWFNNQIDERINELPRTEWYDGKIKPAVEGVYEITTKQRSWEHFATWDGKGWGEYWDGKKIKPIQWRGLLMEFTPEDKQRMIDEIIENS